MSTDKADPGKKDASISSADDLVKTSKSGDVELTEEGLKRVCPAAKRSMSSTSPGKRTAVWTRGFVSSTT